MPEETGGEAVETGVEESVPVEESQPEDEVPTVSVVGWLRVHSSLNLELICMFFSLYLLLSVSPSFVIV